MKDIKLIIYLVVVITVIIIVLISTRTRLPKPSFEPYVYIDGKKPRIEFLSFSKSKNVRERKFYKEYYVGLVIAYNDHTFEVTRIDKVINSHAKRSKRNRKMIVYLKELTD